MRTTVDLQDDFALNQPLSAVRGRGLRPARPRVADYALDVVSVVESTLEDPRQILSAQRNKARGEAVAQMKADGIEYEERMELLEDVTYPEPLDELLRTRTRPTGGGHPWVADYELSAQVRGARHVRARDDVRRVRRRSTSLARSEGLVLRYLADAYRALRDGARGTRTEELEDLIEWLGELVRQVDSSPARRVGAAAPSPSEALERDLAGGHRPPGHRERAGVPGAGAQRDVPPGRAGLRHRDGRASSARAGSRRRTGARRSTTTTPSTRRSAPTPTRAGPRC